MSEESRRVLHIHLPLRGCEDDHVVKAATLEVVKAATLEDDHVVEAATLEEAKNLGFAPLRASMIAVELNWHCINSPLAN